MFGGAKLFVAKMKIGRQGQQPFQITDKRVSSIHCDVTDLGNGTFEIQDLESTNGTFVNGTQIIKCQVSINDKIVLGGSYQLDLTKCFKKTIPTPQPPDPTHDGIFPLHLRKIYEDYTNQKNKIKTSQRNKQNVRMLFMSIPGILGLALGRIFDQEIITGISAICLVISFIILLSSLFGTDKTEKEFDAITDNFKLKYVCGNTFGGKKCGQFLGFDSPLIWESRGCICPKCKKQIN